MTIAAGFRCSDGVLLGADSLIENLDVKYEEEKVFNCSNSLDYGVLLAGSGDSISIKNLADFALSEAFFDPFKETLPKLKAGIRKLAKTEEYRETVKEAKQYNAPVEFLLTLKSADGSTDLVYLLGPRLYSVERFECIGSGSATARYFANWLYDSGLSIRVFAPLALQIFKAAKQHNVGCEGDTKIHKVFTGRLGDNEPKLHQISDAEFLWGLHDLLKPILRCCVDLDVPEYYFQKSLEEFSSKAKRLRENMHSVERALRAEATELAKEARLARQSATPLRLPPSPE